VSAPAKILCGAVTVAAACLGLGVTIVVKLADQFARSVGADDWEPGNADDPNPWETRRPADDEDVVWVPLRTWKGDIHGWEDR
jgi:hypothetical protein